MRTFLPMVCTIGLLIATLFIGRGVFGLQARIHGYSLDTEAFTNNNQAVLIRLSGMMLGLFIAVFTGSYHPVTDTLANNLWSAAQAAALGLGALLISQYVNDKLILSTVDNNDAVVRKKNTAVAVVEAATYLATALIFAGSIASPGSNLFLGIVWFVLGQAFLIGLACLHQFMVPGAVEKIGGGVTDSNPTTPALPGNNACAFSLAGFLFSGGLAIGAAVHGAPGNFFNDLLNVVISATVWIVVMFVSWFVLGLLRSRKSLNTEMVEEDNMSVGLLQAGIFIAFTIGFIAVH